MQTKTDSFIEAVVNILIGLAVGFLSNLIILPLFLGVTLTVATNMGISLFYTAVSLARSYGLRRLFNGKSPWAWVKGKLDSLKAERARRKLAAALSAQMGQRFDDSVFEQLMLYGDPRKESQGLI